MKRLPTIALVLCLAACNAEMESRSEITKFRILGVAAQPAQIVADQPMELSALFAVPTGVDAEPQELNATVAWITIDPSFDPLVSAIPDYLVSVTPVDELGVATLADDRLLFSQGLLDQMLAFDQKSLPVYLLACDNGQIDEQAILEVAKDLAETQGLQALEDACVGDEATALSAFKMLDVFVPRVTEDNQSALPPWFEEVPNRNPTLEFFGLEEDPPFPITNPPAQGVVVQCEGDDGCRDPFKFKVSLTTQSHEYYVDYFGDLHNEMENLYVAWFADGGEFSSSRIRSDDALMAQNAASEYADDEATMLDIQPESHWFSISWLPPVEGGKYHLWIAIHDLRGGASWNQLELEALTE